MTNVTRPITFNHSAEVLSCLDDLERRVLTKTIDRLKYEAELGRKQGEAYLRNLTNRQRAVLTKIVSRAAELGRITPRQLEAFRNLNITPGERS